MNAPIADSVDQELKTSERSRQSERRLHEAQAGTGTINASAQDFMGDLLDAQQRLISAQHQFLHDNDLRALARAQLDVITVQTGVMQRLGVFG